MLQWLQQLNYFEDRPAWPRTLFKSSEKASLKYEIILLINLLLARVERLELPANGFGTTTLPIELHPFFMILISQTAVSNYFSIEVI